MPFQAGTDSPSTSAAESLREARAALLLQRARIIAVMAIMIHPLFGVADWLDFQDTVSIKIRLLVTLDLVLLLGVSYTRWGAQHCLSLVFAGLVVIGANLAFIMWHQNDFYEYEDGFGLLIVTFCVFIPATMAQSALVCAAILALYFGPILLKGGSAMSLSEFGTRVIGLSSLATIALIGRHVANTLWEREFYARQELQQALNELQTTQRQLVQAEKMAALGRLTAGVAHELNNPLWVISTNLRPLERATESLSKDTEDGKTDVTAARQTIARSITLLRRGLERAAAVVQNLNQYATPSRGHYAPTDLNAEIEMTVSLVATKVREKAVTIHREYGTLPPILCDAQSIGQVFVNVLENACDAVAQSGNIWVRTEVVLERHSPISSQEGGAAVLVTIRDDGPGIPPDHLSKLFDPFFTTKPPGAGMGLGLGIVRRIVEDHGGKIEVANGSRGVVVSITLPITSSAVSAQTESTYPLP